MARPTLPLALAALAMLIPSTLRADDPPPADDLRPEVARRLIEASEGVDDPILRGHALNRGAELLATAGDLDAARQAWGRAVAVLDGVLKEEPNFGDTPLMEIARAQDRFGEREAARDTLRKARDTVARMPDGYLKPMTFARIARMFRDLGEPDEARALIDRAIELDAKLPTILPRYTPNPLSIKAEGGDLRTAWSELWAAPGTEDEHLGGLQRILAAIREEDRDEARPILRDALARIKRMRIPRSQAAALSYYIGGLLSLGDRDEAARSLSLFPEDDGTTDGPLAWKGATAARVADAMAEAGRREEALAIAAEAVRIENSLHDPKRLESTRYNAAHAQARAGDLPAVIRTVETIPDRSRRASVLGLALVIATAEGASDPAEFRTFAEAALRAVDESLSHRENDPMRTPEQTEERRRTREPFLLAYRVNALAQLDRMPEATEALARVPNGPNLSGSTSRLAAIGGLTLARVRLHGMDETLGWIGTLDSASDRVYALVALAGRLGRSARNPRP